MLYQVEEIETKKSRKLVIVYVVILLLVLSASICLGIYVAKKVKNKNNENLASVKNLSYTIENEKTEDEESKKQFVENVKNIYKGESGKTVFLTFDDGPSNSVTPHILDKLKESNIKATFFVLGSRVKANPELVKREYNEGRYIANHGYSHKYSKIYASSSDVLKEYNKTEKQIQKALNNPEYSSNLFRFPGGSAGGPYSKIKSEAKTELKKNNIAYLDWNALTNDAAGAHTKEKIIKNLKKTVGKHKNVVLLMHDAPDKILTYETLGEVIRIFKEERIYF